MTQEQIKEAVSYHLVSLLASSVGVKVTKPPYDTGDDFLLIETKKIVIDGKAEFYASGSTISVQLKCTTQKSVAKTEKGIKYDLRVRNYNQLIRRKWIGTKTNRSPLILILVVLNDEQWLVEKATIQIKADIFWFTPEKIDEKSKNKHKVRINIPKTNKIDTTFFSTLFNKIYE